MGGPQPITISVEYSSSEYGMKLKFRHKVFLVFLLNSLVTIICMLLIARYYSPRNFENYVQKVEMERLDELSKTLSREYRENGSWEPVTGHFDQWLNTVALAMMRPFREEPPGRPHGPASPHAHPPGDTPPEDGRTGPRMEPPPPPGNMHQENGQTGPRMEPPPPLPPQSLAQRIALFDSEKRPLTGELTSAEGYRLKPVLVDGRTVGWLGLKKFDHLVHPLDTEFLRLQSRIFYTMSGVALLLAVIVTAILSRLILAPVTRLAQGTRALTLRKFGTRIEVGAKDEFGQLASDFNDLAQALEKYEQNRRQWIADISHELRTPLVILRGEIEAMQDGVRPITREALDSLHFEVRHLSRLVGDLHELSLIESQTLTMERTVVKPLEILEDTLKIFGPRLEERSIRVEKTGLEGRRIGYRPGGCGPPETAFLEPAGKYPPVYECAGHAQDFI